jgi:hypothetical protein
MSKVCGCIYCREMKSISNKCFLDVILGVEKPDQVALRTGVCIKCFSILIPENKDYASSSTVLDDLIYKTRLIMVKCNCGKGKSPGFHVELSSKYIKRLEDIHREAIEIRKEEADKIVLEKTASLKKRLDQTSREAWEIKTSSIPYDLEHKFPAWEETWEIQKELRDIDIRSGMTMVKERIYIEYNIN